MRLIFTGASKTRANSTTQVGDSQGRKQRQDKFVHSQQSQYPFTKPGPKGSQHEKES